jgi:hypothetical protein
VVEDPLCTGFHLTQVFHGSGVGNAIPNGFLLTQKVVEAVNVGLSFQKEFVVICSRRRFGSTSEQLEVLHMMPPFPVVNVVSGPVPSPRMRDWAE